MLTIFFPFIVLHSTIILQEYAVAQEDESTLRKKLLSDYDKTLSPVLFQKVTFNSYLWLSIFRIAGLDESKGEFILEGVLAALWSDDRLGFESDNLKFVRVNAEDVWIPHIHVLNRVEKEEMTLKTKVYILKKMVGWAPRYVFRTSCIPNLKFFPFDKHTCNIIVISMTDEGDTIPANYSTPEYSISHNIFTRFMVENNLWTLVSSYSEVKVMEVDIDVKGFGGIFTFEIERTMPLIALGILCPCLISVLLLLTTFWMKAGIVTRTGMNATAIIVSAGNLFTIGRILPVSGTTTPIIVEYVTCALVLSLISALQSTTVSVMSRCKTQPPWSYQTLIEKMPSWTLYILALVPSTDENVDQSFLFSELVESDNAQQNENDKSACSRMVTDGPWEKHVILFDRFVFYLFGIVLCLLIVSILFTD